MGNNYSRDNQNQTQLAVIPLPPGGKSMTLAQRLGMPPEYVQLVKEITAPKATDEEFVLFLQIVHDTGLNPLTQEIWFYKMWDKQADRDMPVIHAGIKGMRKAAARQGDYIPGKPTEYIYDNNNKLYAAVAYVKKYAHGEWHEVSFTAVFEEFNKGQNKWLTMPKHMIAKCAEFHALQRAFPVLQGIMDIDSYTPPPADVFAPAPPPPPAEDTPAPHDAEGTVEPSDDTPEFTGMTEEPANDEVFDREGAIATLLAVAEIMLTDGQYATLGKWLPTASTDDIRVKINGALAQFIPYVRDIHTKLTPEQLRTMREALGLPEGDAWFDNLGLEQMLKYVHIYETEMTEPGDDAPGGFTVKTS